MRIYSRAAWKARPPKSLPAKVPISSRTATCVHHDGKYPIIIASFAQACDRVRRDQNYHMNSNGWSDIGYNYLVTSAPGTPADGLIFEGRGRDAVGAHCLNHNTPWIGIQVAIGGGQVPSPAALAAVRWLHITFEQAAGHDLSMRSHSDGFNTECPGPILHKWVRAGMPVATPPTKPTTTPEDDMLSAEAQKWVEERLDAHTAFVLQNLKATMGREQAARDAALAANIATVLARLPESKPVVKP